MKMYRVVHQTKRGNCIRSTNVAYIPQQSHCVRTCLETFIGTLHTCLCRVLRWLPRPDANHIV